jgi:hypothetical protein
MRELRAYKDMEPTYNELAKALVKLGFKNKSTTDLWVYSKEETGSVVLLPMKPAANLVNRANFASLSWTLEGQGVLQHEHDLGKMIEQMRLAEKQPSA